MRGRIGRAVAQNCPTMSKVAPPRSMAVAAEWRRRLAPFEGAESMPARVKASRTMPETTLESEKGL